MKIKLVFNKKQIFIIIAICYCLIRNISLASDSVYSVHKKFISYTDMGQGIPLVLIHAFPTDQRLWQPQQSGLQNYFRVITLDLWGFGKSTSTDGRAVTMIDYADEVKQLLDQLHISKAIIGGESMGGYIALAFIEKYPNHVKGLILSDTQSIADNEETKQKREATAQDVLQHGTTELIKNFIPKALSKNASNQTQRFLKNILDEQASTAIASALRGMANRDDTSKLLSTIQLPVLIITGDQDTLIPSEQSQHMHQLSKNSILVTIQNAGHLSSLEQPDKWNEAVIDIFYKNKAINRGLVHTYTYIPPSSLYCKSDNIGGVWCNDVDNNFVFAKGSITNNIEEFIFVSGVATFGSGYPTRGWSIDFKYTNRNSTKNVWLSTIDGKIQPVYAAGSKWESANGNDICKERLGCMIAW